MRIDTIDTDKYSQVYLVGDLHGCYTQLMERLDHLGFNKDFDLLVCTGDLIDRGSENIECLKLLQENWFVSVMGNHEVMAFNGLFGNRDDTSFWRNYGGEWYFKLSEEDRKEAHALIKETDEMPLIIELHRNGRKAIVCHANYPLDRYDTNRHDVEDCLLWDRRRIDGYRDCGEEEYIEGVDLAVFGHTPLKKPVRIANQIFIDSGAVFWNNMEVFLLDRELGNVSKK